MLHRYDLACQRGAHQIIATYSTSFGLATGLLSRPIRRDIRNLYAMVRIADEIVDGTAAEAGVRDIAGLLDDYERAVLCAPSQRFHTDPVLHAYAVTARRCDFNPEYLRAFFTSMRMDTAQDSFNQSQLSEYIYGSAEVIGLLCVAVFFAGRPRPANFADIENGARHLGAGFQKINFLRDLGHDATALGRAYFPGTDRGLDEDTKARILDEIDRDFQAARNVVPNLPAGARAGVVAALSLYEELARMLRATPASELANKRVSVPNLKKIRLTAQAIASARGKGDR